ncbi:NAD(P)-dependent alcohol dehydrogenase [Kineococcus sp. R86509]|uniref:NAD(P)-dependent alcohol dehydrogenase n=1 Tax=Kineococcus sp. R86509 TaxID=3093851 RepID=UPI0036D34999
MTTSTSIGMTTSTTTITAAVAREHGQPLSIEQVELDTVRPDEVRVRLVATGVCHTDAIVRDGAYPTPLPAVLGHEGAGVVEAVGEMVPDIAVGDHVILSAAYCGTCKRCRAGQMAYCEHLFAEDFGGRRHDGTTALTDPSAGTGAEQIISSHFFGQSAFATYANVRSTSVVVVDPDVPLEVLAPLGCGMQTGAGAVLNELRPAAGTSLAVSGAGAVGLAAVMAARIAGCTTVIAIDVHDSRLALAAELGATHVINGKQTDTHEKIMEITGGAGVDFIVDTTAIPALLASAAQSLALRGTLALVGAAKPGTEVPFEIGASLVKGWTFKTIVQGSAVPQVFIPRLVQLWKQGDFPLEKLTRPYRLEEINDAFADSASGAVVKPIVVF